MSTTVEFDNDTAQSLERLRRESGTGVPEAVNTLDRRGLLTQKSDASEIRGQWGLWVPAGVRERSPRFGADTTPETGGSVWNTTLYACASC